MKKILLIMLSLLFLAGCSNTAITIDENLVCDPINESDCAEVAKGNLKVILQDQTTDPIEFYLMQILNNVTIAINSTLENENVTLEPGHGFVTGNYICFQEDNHLFQAEVLNVIGDTIIFDTPLDFNFGTNAYGCRANINMAVDGSSLPHPLFIAKPITGQWTVQWDITRIVCSIKDNTAMDSGKFGGITALTEGVILRKKNGVFKNLFNVKTNGDYADSAFDVEYDDRAPSGTFGFRVRKTWAGQEKSGVAIRLDADKNEELQNVIQDNLLGLSDYRCKVQGSLTN